MSADRYLPAARYVAQEFPGLLAHGGLQPCIDRYVLTESQVGDAWLFVVLDVDAADDPQAYGDPDLLRYLSTSLHELPVFLSSSDGLRYAVLLNPASPSTRSRDR